MAKTIATITGTALVPGVSKNGRWYKQEHITEAVRSARERIRAGRKPMVMLTFHGADDNSREIAATLTDVSLNENGGADFAAGFTDTGAGWDIARMADTTDGKPAHLKAVSIRGAWTGKVRKERGPSGQLVETADGVELDGVDFTRSPGVTGAEIKTFAWVKDEAAETAETTQRVLITESVQEAHVTTFTEDGAPAGTEPPVPPASLREAFSVIFGALEAVDEADTPALSKRDSGLSGGGRQWADPGYLKDKKQRYDISSKAKAKAAWSFISQKDNAAQYTPAQLKRIKGRIKAALKEFGVQVAAEGWTVEPAFRVTEAVAEYMGNPDACGSYSLSATNGPTTVTVCSYGLEPADLTVILQRACAAAGVALCALDPDMDGDIDVPGADAEDTDNDAGDMDNGDGTEDLVRRIMSAVRGESAENPGDLIAEARARHQPASETASETTAPGEAAAAPTSEEGSAVSETTVTEAATAPAAITQADIDAAVSNALAAAEEARRARKAARKAKAAESAAGSTAAVTETAPAAPGEDTLARLVEERLKARLEAEGVTETIEQKVERLVEARVTEAKQQLAARGSGPSRKGLVTEHSAARAAAEGIPADFPMGDDGTVKPMEKWSAENRAAVSDILQRTYLPYLTRGE